MLQAISRYKRSQNVFLLAIIGVMVLGLVVAYSLPTSSLFGSAGPKTVEPVADKTVIASVDGREITAKEYSTAMQRIVTMYRNFAQQSQQNAGFPLSVGDLRKRGTDKAILQSLVRQHIVEMEAERLGLVATRDELQKRIVEQFNQDGRWIGYEKYRRILERQGQNPIEFERNLMLSITEEKLRNFLTSGVQVSSREAEEDYKKANTKLDLSFVVFNDADFEKTVAAPTDAEIQAYFDAHKDEFRATKDQRKIRYIYVSQDKAAETVQVSDEVLRKDFDPEKQIKSARISQIVLNILTPKDEETVLAKANDLVARARGKEPGKGEDFAALARGNSQDKATAEKDGDVGVIERSAVKSGDALENAFSLKLNEISDPIRRGDRYYIFKMTERTSKTFEEAKPSLLALARNRDSYKKASDIADEAVSLFVKSRNFDDTAAKIAAKLNIKPEDVKRETPFFAPGDDVPEIGSNPSFEEKTSVLTAKGDVGEKVGVRGGFAIPQLVEMRKPGEPILAEVKNKVSDKVKKEKSLAAAYEKAKALIAEAKDADGLKAAAEKAGLKVEEAKDVSNSAFLGGKSYPAALYNAEKVKVKDLVPTPLYSSRDTASASVAVVAVTKRTDADLTKFAEQSKSVQERLRGDRASALFENYIDNLKRKLKESGRLKINEELVERVVIIASRADGLGTPIGGEF
jgi:peptidyl-prolyl cis-trans isomerase D